MKKKSMDYILGMITGVAVTITFWACTNTDLIASNETGAVQEVKITNWSEMPAVDIDNWSSMPSQGNGTFPSSIDVNIKSFPTSDDLYVKVESMPRVEFDSSAELRIRNGSVGSASVLKVDVLDVPSGCCD